MSTSMSRRSFIGTAGATAAVAAAAVSAGPARADEAAGGAAPLTADSLNQKWSFEIAPDPITDIAETVDCELVVVGGGTSGLAAACSGAQAGLDTILVSGSTGPVCRGGSNHCTYSKVMEREGVERYDVESFYLSELAANSFRVDNRKWYKFYNNSEESMNWLLDMLFEEGYDASGAQAGLDTILVSGSTGPVCRGGSNHCTYSKVMEREGVERYDVENFYLSELAANSFRVDNRKWYKFYNNSEESMNWLLDMLFEEGYDAVLEITNVDDFDSPTNSPVASHSFVSPDMQMAGVGQAFAVNTLAKNIEAAGGRIDWETVAKQLVRGGKPNGTEGRVEGVICQKADGSYVQYNASKGVVLATGDFSRDKDMMAKYCPWVVDLIDWENNQDYDYDFGLHPNEPLGIFHGDGQKMGLWVGAAWQKVYPNAPMVQGSWVCAAQPYGGPRGLLLDNTGKRFCNEDMGGAGNAMQSMQLPNNTAYTIWGSSFAEDAAPWFKFGQADGADPIPPADIVAGWEESVASGAYVKADTIEEVAELLGLPVFKFGQADGADPIPPADIVAGWEESVASGAYVKADTIEEVAELLGLPVEETVASVERYNEMAAAGKDTDFYKKAKYLQPIADGPFYGAPTAGVVFYTVMGGLRTNENMQVCTDDDQPIPGLYNVGTMAGDMFANIYNFRMQGHNYGQCLCFGYLTGKYIAENE